MPQFINPFVGMVPKRKMSQRELTRALRMSLAAEEEATHLYEALADSTNDRLARAVLQDVANEERVHVGEFQKLLDHLAPGEVSFLRQGGKEVETQRCKLLGSPRARARCLRRMMRRR